VTVYTSEFFRAKTEGSLRSARTVVPIVMELLKPGSVVDVGCGRGTWLSVFAEHGIADVVGVDGDYVDRRTLLIPPDRFVAHDLTTPLRLHRTFDLVVSLEVAEHLPVACAGEFVASLTSLGSAVLFSAAVPGQGGTHHVNERWQDYWAALFAQRGYGVVDCVRWTVWARHDVEPWYAQNTLLYVTPERLRTQPALLGMRRPGLDELAVVHPALYLRARGEALPLRGLIARLPAATARALRRHLSPSPHARERGGD
jgi:SAM-dependent methyltransferase